MAGAQDSTPVKRGLVWGSGIFFVGITLCGWGIAALAAHQQPGWPRDLPSALPGQPPRFGYVEQEPFFGTEGSSVEREVLESDQLHSYGWMDPAHQVAHVPIERAEQLLLQQRGARP